MKVGIYSSGKLWGTIQFVESKLQIVGDQNLYSFIKKIYNPDNQSPEEFVASLPSRLRGRVHAGVIPE